MDKLIRFTKHAEQKFIDLAQLGFRVTKEQVIETLTNPEHIDRNVDPPIAQKTVSNRHVLRVVFLEENNEFIVVTFYPGAKKRYDPEN